MISGKPIPHFPLINLSTWNWIEDPVIDEVTDTLRIVFDEHPPRVWLPWMFSEGDGSGGGRPRDPLTLYVSVPLGENDCDEPGWVVHLRDVVFAAIGMKDLPEDRNDALKIISALRKLADDAEMQLQSIQSQVD